ncbi:MAG: helix-turn-helix transcriptional regulator [Bacteroidales bacterium]|nr:helix-turn-helix transcriptional regulator [Bacteroidales bacterium]
MANKRLEDVAIDRSRSYERKRRASEKEYEKRTRNEDQYSRTLEIAINLFNYIQDTPGMNRALLAEKLHVSQAYICNLINGKLNPSIKTIEKYERILSVRLLPVEVKADRHSIITSLPSCEVLATEFFKKNSEESNFVKYANRVQIFSY